MPDRDLSHDEVAEYLRHVPRDSATALEGLLPLMYRELRHLAASCMRKERANHTLNATALVHEAYLRLADLSGVEWRSRGHVLGVAGRMMRHILVDHARAKSAQKRSSDCKRISLSEVADSEKATSMDLVALDEALTQLAASAPRQAQVVELRYFGGLTLDEIASVVGVGRRSIDRDWRYAQVFLYRRLAEGETHGRES